MRRWIQSLSALLGNLWIPNFLTGKIFDGPTKAVCFPGLNCYSCPAAVGACPLGAMQSLAASTNYIISFYVLGFLTLVGTVLGRWICGWVCPFGLIQELLYKIPSVKLKLAKFFKTFKYGFLLIFVILLPVLWVDSFGYGQTTFCKYICPAGTLEAGIPLLLVSSDLRALAGFLFSWKMFLLLLTVSSSVFIYRPFCKVVCPLGAIYSLFNKVAFLRMDIDGDQCTRCGVCSRVCKMDIDVMNNPNSLECIRCRDCITACPQSAIKMGFVVTRAELNLVKKVENTQEKEVLR